MKFKATIEITPLELKHIIEEYLKAHGIKGVSDQDIHFIVAEVGRDLWKVHELTKVTIEGLRIGEDK